MDRAVAVDRGSTAVGGATGENSRNTGQVIAEEGL